ncbi:MAG: hypothetical protein ACKOTB_06160 [Planctomycetia bacterium]
MRPMLPLEGGWHHRPRFFLQVIVAWAALVASAVAALACLGRSPGTASRWFVLVLVLTIAAVMLVQAVAICGDRGFRMATAAGLESFTAARTPWCFWFVFAFLLATPVVMLVAVVRMLL